MATTLQNIISTLRASAVLDPVKINAGITDGLEPPYANLMDFAFTLDRDTGGPATRNSTFRLVVTARNVEIAEDIAGRLDALIDQGGEAPTITPTAISSFQVGYKIGQEQLYQWVVDMSYELAENIDAVNLDD